jgi:hypothetical protein
MGFLFGHGAQAGKIPFTRFSSYQSYLNMAKERKEKVGVRSEW